jgi:ribosomal protein L37E
MLRREWNILKFRCDKCGFVEYYRFRKYVVFPFRPDDEKKMKDDINDKLDEVEREIELIFYPFNFNVLRIRCDRCDNVEYYRFKKNLVVPFSPGNKLNDLNAQLDKIESKVNEILINKGLKRDDWSLPFIPKF